MELHNGHNIVIIVEGGIVRNVMTDYKDINIKYFVLDHDVEEFTGHKFENIDVIFYEEKLQFNPVAVRRILDEAGAICKSDSVSGH